MTAYKFIKIWVIFIILFLGSAMAVNYFIDPYRLYGSLEINGFNKIKPAVGTHSYQSKIHQAHQQAINALIIGNSRPEMGINPDHVFFRQNKLNVYNLGLRGGSISTQYGYALDILRSKKIKMVLIAVDFIDFITSAQNLSDPYAWPPKKTPLDARRKFNWDGTANGDYPYQYFKDIYLPLISLDTLQDSFITLFSQNNAASDVQDNGFNPARDIRSATLKEGVKTIFNQKIPMLIKSFTLRNWKTYTPGYQWSPDFSRLQFLLNYLRDHGIETKVFINPYHIQYLEVIDYADLTGEFAEWKRELAKIIAKTSKDGKMTLWNFSDPSPYINEPILNAGKKPLRWFWEPAHYRELLGDVMVDNIFSSQFNSGRTIKKFGYKLTPENIESSLNNYNIKLKKYRKDYPEESAFIASKFFSKSR